VNWRGSGLVGKRVQVHAVQMDGCMEMQVEG
jgi:hypothetical protein